MLLFILLVIRIIQIYVVQYVYNVPKTCAAHIQRQRTTAPYILCYVQSPWARVYSGRQSINGGCARFGVPRDTRAAAASPISVSRKTDRRNARAFIYNMYSIHTNNKTKATVQYNTRRNPLRLRKHSGKDLYIFPKRGESYFVYLGRYIDYNINIL